MLLQYVSQHTLYHFNIKILKRYYVKFFVILLGVMSYWLGAYT